MLWLSRMGLWRWRLAYVPLFAMSVFVWSVVARVLPGLDEGREPSGFHRLSVLYLEYALSPAWLWPVVFAALFVASFVEQRLNSVKAVALTLLFANTALSYALVCALLAARYRQY